MLEHLGRGARHERGGQRRRAARARASPAAGSRTRRRRSPRPRPAARKWRASSPANSTAWPNAGAMHRHQDEHRGNERHHPGHAATGIQVAHHSDRHDARARRSETGDHAPSQAAPRSCRGAQQIPPSTNSRCRSRTAGLPAGAVRDWAVDQLPEAQAAEECREHQLPIVGIGRAQVDRAMSPSAGSIVSIDMATSDVVSAVSATNSALMVPRSIVMGPGF